MRSFLVTLFVLLWTQDSVAVTNNQTYSADSGIIYSPNYPSDYDNSLNYFIDIQVESGFYVYLTFLDFETEDCCDKLYIFDGDDVTATPIDILSGVKTGVNYSSTGNKMTLAFHTDLVYTARGFAIKYEQVQVNTKIEVSNQCAPNIQTSEAGFITSPNWPGDYPNNVSCSYKLTSYKNRIMITFVSFLTEPCCDKVYIYDGAGVDSPTLAVISGNMSSSTIWSTGNNMFIYFNSDFTNNAMGFSAFYLSVT